MFDKRKAAALCPSNGTMQQLSYLLSNLFINSSWVRNDFQGHFPNTFSQHTQLFGRSSRQIYHPAVSIGTAVVNSHIHRAIIPFGCHAHHRSKRQCFVRCRQRVLIIGFPAGGPASLEFSSVIGSDSPLIHIPATGSLTCCTSLQPC